MYQVVIKKPAKKFIDRLPDHEKRRIVAAIERLPTTEISKSCKERPAIIAFGWVIIELSTRWTMAH